MLPLIYEVKRKICFVRNKQKRKEDKENLNRLLNSSI